MLLESKSIFCLSSTDKSDISTLPINSAEGNAITSFIASYRLVYWDKSSSSLLKSEPQIDMMSFPSSKAEAGGKQEKMGQILNTQNYMSKNTRHKFLLRCLLMFIERVLKNSPSNSRRVTVQASLAIFKE
jgi:SUMO ligase MMS21 Smc5/6 complex component